jgi:uncharacterized protein YbcI
LEAEIAKAITQFDREHLGRGPHVVRAWIIQDIVLLRLEGVLTPAEEKLARDSERYCLIVEVRKQLIKGSRDMLDEMIQTMTGIQVLSLHSDMSIKRGERLIVPTLAEDLEARVR